MGDFHLNGGMQQETRSLDPTLLEPFLKQAVDRNEAETILIGAKEAKEQVLDVIRVKESSVEPTSQDDDSTLKYKQVLEQLKVPSTSELFSQSPDQSILVLDQTIMYLTREQFQQSVSPNPEPTMDESVAVVTASLISEQPSTSKSTPKSDSILPERKSLTKVPLKDAITDSPTTEATTSEKRRASVVLLAPPTTEQPESKRKPPPVLKSIPLRKGQPLSSDSQPKSRPSVTFSPQVAGPRSLPSAKFEFDNDYSSLKLAGMNGIPSNKMPLPKRPQSQHISPYDMFNLKRENIIGRTTAMALNAKTSRNLVTAASRLTGGINARFDSDYEKGWASLPTSRMSMTAPLQFVEIHVPAVSTNTTTTTDENNIFPHIHNLARTHSPPPPTVPPPTATQPTRPELDATLVQAITDYHTALAQTRYPKPPTTYDTSSLDTVSTPLKHTIRRQSSPNRAILDAEFERRKMQSACEALGGGAGPPSEKVKALIEEFTRTEHGSTSSSRSGKLPGIPHSRKTVRTSPADVGGAEKSHHHHGRLYLSTHGDRSWRFTALPSISQ